MADEHNPDTNPAWRPLMAARRYACTECGTEKTITTNHSGTVWAEPCGGSCRDISNPHTACERVTWRAARPHRFIGNA